MAREKDTQYLDAELLQSFVARACLAACCSMLRSRPPKKTVKTWLEINPELPLDSGMRQRINEQFKYVPLTRQFLKESERKPRASARQRARRAAKAISRLV